MIARDRHRKVLQACDAASRSSHVQTHTVNDNPGRDTQSLPKSQRLIQHTQRSAPSRAEVVTEPLQRPEIVLATCESEAASFGFSARRLLGFSFHLTALPVVCMSLCSPSSTDASRLPPRRFLAGGLFLSVPNLAHWRSK